MATPEDATATMIANLKEKTGKTIDEWVGLAKASGKGKHGELLSWLKADHGMGHGYANLVAHATLNPTVIQAASGSGGGDELVEAQYAGAKSALKPIYETLIGAVGAFGQDVEISPKKTYVSLRRKKQFALVQPTTATRVDVGIQLKGDAPSGRLEASGSFNSMVSHRVRVERAADVDAELIGWLKKAYEGA